MTPASGSDVCVGVGTSQAPDMFMRAEIICEPDVYESTLRCASRWQALRRALLWQLHDAGELEAATA